ncbi:hypothetical protein FACS1894141_6720 [Spirochaetia bacterium]|nr:hypothetical protein FACS1894141_6720 [Spirochaetia bacterium]
MKAEPKKTKQTLFAIVGFAILIVIFGGVYIYQQYAKRNTLAARIAEYGPRKGLPETLEGLQKAIDVYEEQIEQHVKDAAQTGVYWKILAIRLSDRSMYAEALEALEWAIHYSPEEATLHYLTGVAAGNMAKSAHDFGSLQTSRGIHRTLSRDEYFALCESAYLRALQLDSTYSRPMYGIGVLYIYELDRPEEAIPYLVRYLGNQKNDVDAMFHLARAYYVTEQFQNALDLYDRIITTTKDAAKRTEAENNKEIVLGVYYG